MDYLIIFFIALGQRLLVRINEPTSYDSFGHLFFIKSLNEQNLGPFDAISLKKVGATGHFSHPFLFHWLLRLVHYELLMKYQFLVNPLLDSFFVGFVFFLLPYIGLTNHESFIVVLLYIFTPLMFTRLSVGPRTSSFTPRLFSEVIGGLFFIFLFFPFPLSYIEVIIITSLLASITMLSSKFGVQVILFLTPIAALFSDNMNGIYSILIAFLICIIVTRGRFIGIIMYQINHLTEYFINNLKKNSPISDRNSFNKLIKVIKEKKINDIISQFVVSNSFTATMIKLPAGISFLVLLAAGYMGFVNINDSNSLYEVVVLAAVLLFFLINMPWLLFLGEAERYLNFVIMFIIISLFFILKKNELLWFMYVLIIYGFLYSIIEVLVFGGLFKLFLFVEKNVYYLKSIADNLIVTELKKIAKPLVVLSYPYHAAGGWRIVAETNHAILYPVIWGDDAKTNFKEYEGVYPFINLLKFKDIVNKYNVNVLIVNTAKLNLNYGKIDLPDGWCLDQKLSNQMYDVYRI